MENNKHCPFCNSASWEGFRILYDNSTICRWCKQRAYFSKDNQAITEKEEVNIEKKEKGFIASLMDDDKVVDVTFIDEADTSVAWTLFYKYAKTANYTITNSMYIKIINRKYAQNMSKKQKKKLRKRAQKDLTSLSPSFNFNNNFNYNNYGFQNWPREPIIASTPAWLENTIEVTPYAYRKMKYYAKIAGNDEISGMGLIEKKVINAKEHRYIVTDVFLFKQQSSAGDTKLDKDALAKFQVDMIKAGKDLSALRFWWHSHGNGSPFWSMIDEANVNRFNSDDYMVSIVINRWGQMLGRVDLYEPDRQQNDTINPIVSVVEDKKLYAQCKQEVQEKNRRWFNRGKGKNKCKARQGFRQTSFNI